jgi:hypothetical protein
MKHTRTLIWGLLIPMAILVTSCSKREGRTVAEFKDQKITVGEFETAYANVNPIYLPAAGGYEGKVEFLNTMLNKAVMAYKADELGYDKDPSVVQGMESYRKMGLQTGYLKHKVSDKVVVTEAQVEEHYRNRGATLSIKQILCDTPADADEAFAALEGGLDFETAARQYSRTSDAPEGGKVVTVNYGNYAPVLQEKIFSLAVGEYTDPIITPYGFFIIKALRRTEATRKDPYEEIHATLKQPATSPTSSADN